MNEHSILSKVKHWANFLAQTHGDTSEQEKLLAEHRCFAVQYNKKYETLLVVGDVKNTGQFKMQRYWDLEYVPGDLVGGIVDSKYSPPLVKHQSNTEACTASEYPNQNLGSFKFGDDNKQPLIIYNGNLDHAYFTNAEGWAGVVVGFPSE